MKFIANMLIALLALYGAYKLYETYAPLEYPRFGTEVVNNWLPPTNSPAATQPSPTNSFAAPQPPPPAPPPEADIRRIICPTCHGEEKLTYADQRNANHVYACPICSCEICSIKYYRPIKGHRCIRVPAGYDICPDCKGMGLTERREPRQGFGGNLRANRCLRCGTSGVIKLGTPPPASATPGVQPPDLRR